MRLYDTSQTKHLYRILPSSTATDGSEQKQQSGGTAAQGNLSAVGRAVESASLCAAAFPLLARAQYTETVLRPGDALYIPHGVWHYVRSLETSLSVNFWF